MVKSYIVKKIVLLFVITFCGLIGYAQNWKIGVYYNALNQRVNFLEESSQIFQKNNDFNSFKSGIKVEYLLNETLSLKMNVGISQKSSGKIDSSIPIFSYKAVPVGLRLKTNLFNFSNFKIYIENGVSLAFCYSYTYNRIIGSSTSNITGSVSDYNFTNNLSYGFVNGIGISYLIKSKFEIDIFANYYSGINKVWENNSILINEVGGGQNFYTISSNGSCINIGLGLGYCF